MNETEAKKSGSIFKQRNAHNKEKKFDLEPQISSQMKETKIGKDLIKERVAQSTNAFK